MSAEFRIKSEVRGPSLFGESGVSRWKALTEGQPLILNPEPMNPVDRNAVTCVDLFGRPVGYVAREHAGEVAPLLQKGVILLCKVIEKAWPIQTVRRLGVYTRPQILIWRDGEDLRRKSDKVRQLAKAYSMGEKKLDEIGTALWGGGHERDAE